MCISVLSTSHPDYPFILISNRDEYISRPTLRANWWDPPNQQVLGGRDTQRAERGTWLGITKQGRIAVLTNFREEGVEVNKDKSRGAITNSYLCIPPESKETEEDYVRRLLNETGIHDVGGFTLIFGKLRSSKNQQNAGLAVVSNRTSSAESLTRIATTPDETHGLSNSHYGDRTWPKVVHGEELLSQTIQTSRNISQPQSEFIESLFHILSIDTLPKRQQTEDWDAYVRHMRDSILISPAKGELAKRMANYVPASTSLKASAGTDTPDHAQLPVSETAYGTSKQTVILVDTKGKVTFVERTLFDQEGRMVKEDERDLRYEFQIEGWEGE
ncbi:Transport and Golgi organization protein 2-like [Pseudocercospora fuligena]|uniref:Transport and Golgi organization protein 2-like n=1 Tax=Pseudocercospora fuligena TaxID=685502 RepID=A0A8H6RVB9_9PEZI|nr:Transport and Golgi organization protein 2-like [Pseudocercospora fuligena]